MLPHDNSVNIKIAPRAYHHGDLRAALLSAGLAMLKERTLDGLSLREIARKVGVSATAVYRHFPDKQALLYALCQQGAEQLGRVQQEAMAAAGGGLAGFEATGRAYVRFALDHPTLFRLMMTTRPADPEGKGSLSAMNSAMRLLKENVASLLPEGASEDDKRIAIVKSWAAVHGLAMLMLDGQVPPDDTLLQAIAQPFSTEPD